MLRASRESFYEWFRLSNALLITANQASSVLYIISGGSLNSGELFIALQEKKIKNLSSYYFGLEGGSGWEAQEGFGISTSGCL